MTNLIKSVSYLMAYARGRRGGSVSEDNCVKCKKKSGGCRFQCNACDSWTHVECMSMTADEYQTLKKFPNFRCYCDYCFPKTTVNATFQCAEKKNNLSFWKRKSKKHFISSRKKWMKVKWRLPKTYANNIHKTVVPAFEFKTSRKLHHKVQRRGFSPTWSTSWLLWNIQLVKNPLFPTVSHLVIMTKRSEEASSWSSQIFGRHEKFWQIFTIWKIIQLITVLLCHVN